MSYVLIDAPITPYSTEKEIKAWIAVLEAKQQSEQVIEALNYARELLEFRSGDSNLSG